MLREKTTNFQQKKLLLPSPGNEKVYIKPVTKLKKNPLTFGVVRIHILWVLEALNEVFSQKEICSLKIYFEIRSIFRKFEYFSLNFCVKLR